MKTMNAYDDRFVSRKGKFSVPLLVRPILGNGPIRRIPAPKERLNIRRFLAGMVLAILIAIPKVSYAIAGVEGTLEYAFDAPWRLEPSIAADGKLKYGKIPIQLSIHDAMHSNLDNLRPVSSLQNNVNRNNVPATLGNICRITVYEDSDQKPDACRTDRSDKPCDRTDKQFSDLAEVEATWGAWKPPSNINNPTHKTCRLSDGSPCTDFRNVGPTSEWHGLLWYSPRKTMVPGNVIPLGIEMELTRDGGDLCDVRNAANRITLYNEVKVYLGDAPLPRFDAGWLYGDLHYHSQGSDNEGESGYNYRGVVRAMGALGLDFVFATDHASNSEQVIDADLKLAIDPLDIHRGVLRDMSRQRFSEYYDLIYGPGGVNQQAAFETGSGQPPQSFISHGVVPQLFLGGEIDVIPEVASPSRFEIPYGNELSYDLTNLCGSWRSELALGRDCPVDKIWEYVPATNSSMLSS